MEKHAHFLGSDFPGNVQLICLGERRPCSQVPENQMGEESCRWGSLHPMCTSSSNPYFGSPSLPPPGGAQPSSFLQPSPNNSPPRIKKSADAFSGIEGGKQLAWAVEIWRLLSRFPLSTWLSPACPGLCLEGLGCEPGSCSGFQQTLYCAPIFLLEVLDHLRMILIQSSSLSDLCLKPISFLLGLPGKHHCTFSLSHSALLCPWFIPPARKNTGRWIRPQSLPRNRLSAFEPLGICDGPFQLQVLSLRPRSSFPDPLAGALPRWTTCSQTGFLGNQWLAAGSSTHSGDYWDLFPHEKKSLLMQ